jgi:hypothetical protein
MVNVELTNKTLAITHANRQVTGGHAIDAFHAHLVQPITLKQEAAKLLDQDADVTKNTTQLPIYVLIAFLVN